LRKKKIERVGTTWLINGVGLVGELSGGRHFPACYTRALVTWVGPVDLSWGIRKRRTWVGCAAPAERGWARIRRTGRADVRRRRVVKSMIKWLVKANF
jgi:hypothetical protein